MTQHLCEVKRQHRLPRTVFIPEPKVNIPLNRPLQKANALYITNCVFRPIISLGGCSVVAHCTTEKAKDRSTV